MINKAYELRSPEMRTTPLVLASPHSGRDYPRRFRRASVLGELALRSSEDAFVDELFAAAPELGAPLLCAKAPRAFVDVNRGPDELDPALIAGVGRRPTNARVAAGLGVIPRVVAGGRAIYRGKIPRAEAEARIRDYWHPWHARLGRLLAESRALFGEAILLDCHSMPHEALEQLCASEPRKPEVVLGDRFGASAAPEMMARVEAAFVRAGFRVARNKPFAGAYTAQHYGRPSRRQHVIQVEIDRALYMNEAALRPNANFAAVQRSISGALAELCGARRAEGALAAE